MYVKYPRTCHLPWSPGLAEDGHGLVLFSTAFEGREVVITEKMDGENTTLYRDRLHARSLSGGHHESQAWVRNFHAGMRHQIPPGWRVCGENLYAVHSIAYHGLPSYFLAFSIWDDKNTCQSWDDTVAYAAVLGLEMVPLIYRGPWDEGFVRSLGGTLDTERSEGYVVRVADSFSYEDFGHCMAKWVRGWHVRTPDDWKAQRVVKNSLSREG